MSYDKPWNAPECHSSGEEGKTSHTHKTSNDL